MKYLTNILFYPHDKIIILTKTENISKENRQNRNNLLTCTERFFAYMMCAVYLHIQITLKTSMVISNKNIILTRTGKDAKEGKRER